MAEQIRSADLMVKDILSDQTKMDAIKQDPGKLKEFAAAATRQLPDPTPPANDSLWLIIVGAFALVMVGSACVLGFTVATELKAGVAYVTKSETIVTLFTTVVAFLAGLLSPSPIKKS